MLSVRPGTQALTRAAEECVYEDDQTGITTMACLKRAHEDRAMPVRSQAD
jgi:hypothetical protein